MEPVTVNFAMTRDDYINGRLAQMKMLMPKTYHFSVKFMGIDLIVLACVLLVMGNLFHKPVQWLCAVLVAIGVFLLLMYFPTIAAVVRRRAANEFDAGRGGTPAHTVSFREDCVEVSTERYEAKIPYELFYSAYEDDSVILLYTGIGECRSVPKRTMDGAEQKRVESLLAERLKQKFKQEGAREWTK